MFDLDGPRSGLVVVKRLSRGYLLEAVRATNGRALQEGFPNFSPSFCYVWELGTAASSSGREGIAKEFVTGIKDPNER